MRATAWALLAVLSCVACNGGGGEGGGDDAPGLAVRKLVGPEGGTVEVASGAKVTIPPGALKSDTWIEVAELSSVEVATPPDKYEAAGKPYAFKPHGQVFETEVTIEVPYEGKSAGVSPIKLPNETKDSSMWAEVADYEKDDGTKKVSIETVSFSVIMAVRSLEGVPPMPDAGGDPTPGKDAGVDAGDDPIADAGTDSGGTDSGGSTPGNGDVAFYPNHGANWNDYVVRDGDGVTGASDTACNAATDGPGYDACIHGGEVRAIAITGQTSCVGLFISDMLGLFEWTCVQDGASIRAVSTGLKDGKYLSDLLDFTAVSWKPNSVIVSDEATTLFTSTPSVWWSNPVVADNDGIDVGATTPGTVYIVTQNVTADYNISTSKTAFVVRPGSAITPVSNPYAALYLGDPNGSNPIDFNWIEGTANGNGGTAISGNEHRFGMLRNLHAVGPASNGLNLYCAKSKIVDFTSDQASNTGLNLSGKECSVEGAVISGSTSGIYLNNSFTSSASGPNTVQDVTISGGVGSGSSAAIAIAAQSSGNTLRNLTISNSPRIAIQINSSNNVVDGATITTTSDNNSNGIVVGGSGNRLENLAIHGGYSRSISLTGSGHRIDKAKLALAWDYGIDVTGTGHQLSNLVISRVWALGGGAGLRLFNTSRTRVWNVMVGNTGDPPYGGQGRGIETTFTGGTGSEDVRSDNIFSNVYLANNGIMGFGINGSQSNVFQYLTVTNTGHVQSINTSENPVSYGGRGVYFASGYIKGNTFNNLLLANNADTGLDVDPHITGTATDHVTGTTFNHLAILGNGGRSYFPQPTGIRLGEYAVDVVFKGVLLLSNNGADVDDNCIVTNDGTPKTEGGLTDSSVNTSCTPIGSSTATLDTSISGFGLVGAVTSDTANQSDTAGVATFAGVADADWARFDDPARMWGRDGSAFPAQDNWGMCRNPGNCRIYDWSLQSSDVDVRAILPVPTGNDVLVHTFYANDETKCAAVPATWTGSLCRSTFLINAVEIMDDAIGNENLLCESNETCLYTPNIGAYQGHGPLVSAGTFTPGTVTGVTLLRHQTNGR